MDIYDQKIRIRIIMNFPGISDFGQEQACLTPARRAGRQAAAAGCLLPAPLPVIDFQ